MKRAFLVLSLLLIAGCIQPTSPVGFTPLTGTEGIYMEPLDEVSEVYEVEPFEVVFRLENMGGVTVGLDNPGRYVVSYDKLYLQYLSKEDAWSDVRFGPCPYAPSAADAEVVIDGCFALANATPMSLGEETFIYTRFQSRPIQRFSEAVETQAMLTLCYPYKSLITENVCIELDRTAEPGEVVCTDVLHRPLSVGAPLVVSSVDVRQGLVGNPGENYPTFRIEVMNEGGGIPSNASCSSDNTRYLGSATISANLLGEPLICTPSTLRFNRDRATTVCTFSPDTEVVLRGGQGNFETLLNVDISYTYRESVSAPILVLQD